MIQICITLMILSWLLEVIYGEITKPSYCCVDCGQSAEFRADFDKVCAHVIETGHAVHQFGFDEDTQPIKTRIYKHTDKLGMAFVCFKKES